MTPLERDSRREELRELLVGATVLAVESPEYGKTECIAKITVERSSRVSAFHLHATELGWWLSGVKTIGSRASYLDVREVVTEILDHLGSTAFDEFDFVGHGHEVLVPRDDVRDKLLGFHCTVTGREWWFGMNAAKSSPWHRTLQTPESQTVMAAYIGSHLTAPPQDVP